MVPIRKCGISSTSRGSNPVEGASAEVYLCSVTLISLMAGECRVATEVAVANQPKVCRIGAEGVLPWRQTCTPRWCRGPDLNRRHLDFQWPRRAVTACRYMTSEFVTLKFHPRRTVTNRRSSR